MNVMLVRHMRMRMDHGLVGVRVAVGFLCQSFCVLVAVMAVVVAMGMLVLKLAMLVHVRMGFRQVKHDACHHEGGADQHPGTSAALAEQKREGRAHSTLR